ncbi:DEKNAAC101846 [Brettanomyces naardenensis]|uniref:DEKNAAC101846 n=1 Tax=Brettanomyces naardenensis TaxID=13370 RepID=A0A448YJ25_BRENA|nr:DEKNAAC101846 [Brettanomyces naardenensis]
MSSMQPFRVPCSASAKKDSGTLEKLTHSTDSNKDTPGKKQGKTANTKPDRAVVKSNKSAKSLTGSVGDPSGTTTTHSTTTAAGSLPSIPPLSSFSFGPFRGSIVTPFLNNHITDDTINSPDEEHHYCYRHNPKVRCNKAADEIKMTEIQKKLEKLPRADQEAISHVWSIFSAAPNQQRSLILQGLLTMCCFPQLSLISQEVSKLIRIDFIETLPNELALKVLCYLDCQSLCSAAQVSVKWKQMADDDRVWRHMCEQHIDRKCPQCGWGLPLMAVKKLRETPSRKRKIEDVDGIGSASSTSGAISELKTEDSLHIPPPLEECRAITEQSRQAKKQRRTRPWKAVYSERYKVERNWRKGVYKIRKFEGHSDGVLCCQYDNNNLLMTGSYDKTIKIWNVDTGKLLRTLTGHTRGVRTLAFDDQKLISGGLDGTIKVWNYRTGQCISTYTGHSEGVISVDFHDKLIVSGSADSTVKVWHVDTRTCYTLRGHTDWVTSVKIHTKSRTLFTASDDATVRLWDLRTNKCLKVFGGVENNGHIGQIQCVIPFTVKDKLITDVQEHTVPEAETHDTHENHDAEDDCNCNDKLLDIACLPTHMLTASLDNTIKLWDVHTGKCIRTQFGHIEGVWSIAADTFRIVSGAHDRTIKVWDLQTGQCMHTFGGHVSPISCVALGDSRIVCGLENGEVKMYCFDC